MSCETSKLSSAIAERLRSEAKALDFAWKPTVVIAWVCLLLTIEHYHAQMDWYWAWWAKFGLEQARGDLRFVWIRPGILFPVAGSILILLIIREPLKSYGLGVGDWRLGLRLCLLFCLLYLPLAIIFYCSEGFQNYYGNAAKAIPSFRELLAFQAPFTIAYMVRTELIYRGLLVFSFKHRYGVWAGILASMTPYVLCHFNKPEIETLGSFPVGLALAYLAVRTNSIWYGAALHGGIALAFVAVLAATLAVH